MPHPIILGPMADPRNGAPEVIANVRIPDFFIVGASRSGTTSLHRYLSQHPSIFMSLTKEPHFLSPDIPQGWRISDQESYFRCFAACPKAAMAGEASTSYLPSQCAAFNIRQLQPRARIIMTLRNPIDRAYSMHGFMIKHANEELPFESVLKEESQRISDGWPIGYHYVRVGKYYDQVKRYLDTFPADRVKIFLFEDLVRDPKSLCRETFAFLGVDPDYPVDARKIHNRGGPPRNRLAAWFLTGRLPIRHLVGKHIPYRMRRDLREGLLEKNLARQPEMGPDTRAGLIEEFRPDIERLETLLGRDLSHWLSPPAGESG